MRFIVLHGKILEMIRDNTAYCYRFLTRSLNFINLYFFKKLNFCFLYQLMPCHNNPTQEEKKNSLMDTFLNLLKIFWRMQNYRGFTNDPVYKVYHFNTNDIDILISFLSAKETFKEKKSNQCLKNPLKNWYFGKLRLYGLKTTPTVLV